MTIRFDVSCVYTYTYMIVIYCISLNFFYHRNILGSSQQTTREVLILTDPHRRRRRVKVLNEGGARARFDNI